MKIEIVNEKLKEARDEIGLSQEEVAQKTGLDRKSINRWEKKKYMPRIDALAIIANFFGKPMSYFFGENVDIEYNKEENNAIDTENPSNSITEEITYMEKKLNFDSCVDEIVKTYCAGILKSNGSSERVSYAMAGLAGYLRVIVNMVPKIKENTYFLVAGILQTLSKSSMEPNRATVDSLMPSLINNISNLKDTDSLHREAVEKAEDVIKMLLQARDSKNEEQEIDAVLAAVQWLLYNWPHISAETASYYALNTVCCLLASSPTDYDTRNNLVIRVNSFFQLLRAYENN